MRTRKAITVGTLTIVASLAVGMAVINSHKQIMNGRAGGTDYTIVLDSSNAYASGASKHIETVTGGWEVEFAYDSCSASSGNHAAMADGGTIFNVDHILSVNKINVSYSGGTLKYATSMDATNWSDPVALVQGSNDVLGDPYHIKLIADGAVTLASATYTYSCEQKQVGLTETAKTYNIGVNQIKLAGYFPAGMSVARAYRQGANNLDWINGAWQQCSASYFEVVSDGLIVKKGILDQVYQTCTFSIYLNDDSEHVFTLTSDTHWFCNLDETMTWHSSLAEPYASVEIVNGVEGMTGNCLKVTSTDADSTWYNRVFCFQNNGTDWGWNTWELDNAKNYEITFDFKVALNGATHDLNAYLGWYYFIKAHQETAFGIDYTDGAVHQMRVSFAGSDCEGFAIGLDPRIGDLVSSIYIDNFRVKEVH